MSERLVRFATISAATLVLLCVAVLTFDHFSARLAQRRDEARLESIQKKVRQDAAQARVLYAEQQRLTRARDARNTRAKYLPWALIAASVIFISGAKWLIGRQPKTAPSPPAPRPAQSPALPIHDPAFPIHDPAFQSRDRQGAVLPPLPPPPPPIDLAFVDELVARDGTGAEAAITILQAIQDHYRYLPDEALLRVCELTEITPAQIAGTSSFYSRFRRGPVGKHIVRVCHGTACHVSGARQITEQLRRDLEIPEGSDTDLQRLFTLEEVACLGCCSLAPVLMVDEHTAGKLTPATARDALDAVHPREHA